MDKILNDLKDGPMTFKDILLKYEDFSTKETVDILHNLFVKGLIKKERKENDIVFSFNETPEQISVDDFAEDVLIKNADYHAVSKLARKFRGNRFKVERDVKKKKITYSLKLEKKDKKYFIFYCSNANFFKKTNKFNDILSTDTSIRIVASDATVKMEILKYFDQFVSETFGSYVEFRNKNSFFILTEKEFFVRTTWKRLLG